MACRKPLFFLVFSSFATLWMKKKSAKESKLLWKEWVGTINTKETLTILDLAKNLKLSLLSLFPVDGWKHRYLPQFPDEP